MTSKTNLPGLDDIGTNPQGVSGSSPEDLIAFLSHVTERGPIDVVEVYQTGLGDPEKIRSFSVKSGIDPIELSKQVNVAIVTWAQGLGRRTTFVLKAWAGTELKGQHPVVREVVAGSKTLGPSEPPDEKGFLAMTMRFSNENMRIAHQMADANAGHLSRLIREQAARIKELEAAQIAVFNQIRANMIASVDIEHMREQNRMKTWAMSQAIAMAIQQVPSLIQKFTANGTIDSLKGFVLSLDNEQRLAIGMALKPEQQEALLKLFQSLEKQALLEKQLGAMTQQPQAGLGAPPTQTNGTPPTVTGTQSPAENKEAQPS